MAIKELLVDQSSDSEATRDVAVVLARRFGAHLIGLHVTETNMVPGYTSIEMRDTVIKLIEQRLGEQLAAAKERFERAVAGTTLSTEWRAVRGPAAYHLALQARYADLVVVGQPEDSGRDVIDHLILAAGRPVLLVPRFGKFLEVGNRVLVAWDESRESARAINDALPFLQTAKSVTVIAVASKQGVKASGGSAPSRDMSQHLARHGITVESSYDVSGEISIADILLSRASDLGSDLIVMGAYGHARVREIVMGGVTRSILQHMTVPILMSH
jgi:nucleotide-binding universal stress UspA family protein